MTEPSDEEHDDVCGEDTDGWDTIQSWVSRTARFELRRRDGERIVVKFARSWSAIDAATVFRAHRRWAAILDSVEGVRAVRAVGFGEHPACVALEYVEGVDLDEWWSESRSDEIVAGVVRRCGAALGSLHLATQEPAAPSGVPSHALNVLSVGDFAPYNVRLSADGELVVIDPSPMQERTTVLRDVAWFLFWARRSLPRSIVADAREWFLDGYQVATGLDLRSGDGDAALSRLLGRYAMVDARRFARRRRLVASLKMVGRGCSDFVSSRRRRRSA